jgi:hypothetical protein
VCLFLSFAFLVDCLFFHCCFSMVRLSWAKLVCKVRSLDPS